MIQSLSIKIVPIFLLLLIILLSFYIILRDKFKTFIKVFIKYALLSIVIISIFTTIYFIIIGIDIQSFSNNYPNKFEGLNLSKEAKIQLFNQYMEIKNLNWSAYTSLYKIIIDLFYFSSMTFFTVGYGDITIIGPTRFYPILEALIGVATTSIFISMVLSEQQKLNNKLEYIKIRLNNSWNILSIYEINYKSCLTRLLKPKSYHITLINNLNEIKKYYYVSMDADLKEFMEEFKIKWDFDSKYNCDINYFTKFAMYIHIELHFSNHELNHESYKFIRSNSKINLKEFCLFLDKIIDIERNNRKNDKINSDESPLNEDVLNYIYSATSSLHDKLTP